MEPIRGNLYSHLTAKERQSISFPARYVWERGRLKGKVLDFGCGLGTDVAQLKEKGVDIAGYDPHYAPGFPTEQFDTIICFYVLNVLLPEEQAAVLMDISALIKPGGRAYFAVRRDVQQGGYRIHRVHKKPTYQCNVRLPFKSLFCNDSCEIYEYQPYTELHYGGTSVSPFFTLGERREMLVETATAFAIYDKYPVNPGHALVIPKRLVANYFDLSWKEQAACWMIVNRVKSIVEAAFEPAGFNVGINVSEAGGQTIPHVHIHIIPRYAGDVPEPRGGVRGVVPEKKEY